MKRTPLNKRSKKRKKQVDDDTEFYEQIWSEREHHCEECVKIYGKGPGSWLGDTWQRWMFSHLLTKAAHPKLRRVALNIALVCFRCHQQYEFGKRKSMLMWPEWEKRIDELYELEQNGGIN